jgi:hypothetical protein
MYDSKPHTILSVNGAVGSAQATRHEIIGFWQQNPARVENWALAADDLRVPTVRLMKMWFEILGGIVRPSDGAEPISTATQSDADFLRG